MKKGLSCQKKVTKSEKSYSSDNLNIEVNDRPSSNEKVTKSAHHPKTTPKNQLSQIKNTQSPKRENNL